MSGKIIAYKGFDKDFACRGFQYKVGETYKQKGSAEVCVSGFHGCENPFDIWSHYGPFESRFGQVILAGKIDKDSNNTKIAATKLTVVAELSLRELLGAAVDWLMAPGDNPTIGDNARINDSYAAHIYSCGNGVRIVSSGDKAEICSGGYNAKIGSIGDDAYIGSSGDEAHIGSSGDSAQIGSCNDAARIGSKGYAARICSSGYNAHIGSSGDEARISTSGQAVQIRSTGKATQIGSSGNAAQISSRNSGVRIGSSGHDAQIGSSGHDAQISSSGDDAKINSSGHHARISSSGYHALMISQGAKAVIVSAGTGAYAMGKVGTWISLAEFDFDNNCIGFATGCIGKNGLKPDTFYKAKNGKLVEVVLAVEVKKP